jgi:RNA polymerase sigma-70 factor, ECF subfamily
MSERASRFSRHPAHARGALSANGNVTAPHRRTPPGPIRPIDLDALFRQYAVYVATIAFRILGARDELDDVVQDVFLRAHRSLRLLRNPQAVAGWLATVTVRVSQRRLRARKLRRWLRVEGPSPLATADPGASPETKATVGAVFRALEALPVNAQIAWSLRYLQGERLQRVAHLCGCSLAAAKRRIAKAQAVLGEV